MLDTNQLSDLNTAQRDLDNKKLLLNNLIDVQALLRILVDKGIITKDEVQDYRNEVRRSTKYAVLQQYIDETQQEIDRFRKDPQSQLKEMMRRKMEGK